MALSTIRSWNPEPWRASIEDVLELLKLSTNIETSVVLVIEVIRKRKVKNWLLCQRITCLCTKQTSLIRLHLEKLIQSIRIIV